MCVGIYKYICVGIFLYWAIKDNHIDYIDLIAFNGITELNTYILSTI